MSFPTITWSPRSRTGYRMSQQVHQTYAGVETMTHFGDRPRRFWQCVARVSDADWASIEALYSSEIASQAHGGFTLTDPWTGNNYSALFVEQPRAVRERLGVMDVEIALEEASGGSHAAGSPGAYPTTAQAQGSREIGADRLSVVRHPYGGVDVYNPTSERRRRLILVHTYLDATTLGVHLDHYEASWASTFSLTSFQGEGPLTVSYARPPAVGQVMAVFRITNELIPA